MNIKGRFHPILATALSATLISNHVQAKDAYCLQDSWIGLGQIYFTENVMIYEGSGSVKARVERLNDKTYLLNDVDGSTAFRVRQEKFGFSLIRIGNTDPDIICFNEKETRAIAIEKIAAMDAEEEQKQEKESQDKAKNTAYLKEMRELLEDNWRIPSSSRNGMSAFVQIELFPNGDVDIATISHSSGDMPFDRSVLQAVKRVGHFDFIDDIDPVEFERKWRKVLIEFRPEGLRW